MVGCAAYASFSQKSTEENSATTTTTLSKDWEKIEGIVREWDFDSEPYDKSITVVRFDNNEKYVFDGIVNNLKYKEEVFARIWYQEYRYSIEKIDYPSR